MSLTAAALVSAFKIDPRQACKLVAGAKQMREQGMKGNEVLAELERQLELAGLIFHGIEYLPTSDRSRGVYYINSGDTYASTILFDVEKKTYKDGVRRPLSGFSVGSWGDLVERQPRRFAD